MATTTTVIPRTDNYKHKGKIMNSETAYSELTRAIIKNEGVECENYPEAFFAIEEAYTGQARQLEVRFAKGICSTCPVKRECLNYALIGKEETGIWGGLTAKERHELRLRVI